jgi:hypothetical protein
MVVTKDAQSCSQMVRIAGQPDRACYWLKYLKMSNIEHFPACGKLHDEGVKTKELTLKQILSVPCPTCGAALEEGCVLHTGVRRTEPHRDRKLSAAEAVETKASKRSK